MAVTTGKCDSQIEIFNTVSRGRGIKSKVPLTPGSQVLASDPYVFVSTSQMHGKICDNCFTLNQSFQRCSSCKFAYYCGRTCQRMAWNVHRLECKYLKKIYPKIPTDTVRLIALLLLKNCDSHDDWLHRLTSHCDEISKEKSEIFPTILTVIKIYLADKQGLNNHTIFQHFCKINCNAFTITDGETKPIGLGLYPTASFINHSCCPNCVAVFHGPRCFIRCIEVVPTGAELCVSYTELLRPHHVRRKELRDQYFFECTCKCCQQEITDGTAMNALKCPNDKCFAPTAFQPGVATNTCSACGTQVPTFYNSSAIKELYQMIEISLSSINILVQEKKHSKALTVCESLLDDALKTLHCINYQILRIVDKASDICIEIGQWQKALDYCKKSVLGYKKFYPKYHPSIGLQLYRIGKLELHLDMVEAGFNTLSQAKVVLDVCHGQKHALTLELNKLLFRTAQQKQFLLSGQPGRMLCV